MKYSVLIRTYNSGKTLPETLNYIKCQSMQPEQYVIVDSGSVDNTREVIPNNSKFIEYRYDKFNYSLSLNQGIENLDEKYVLIISSHTILENANAVQFAMNLLEARDDIGAAYFTQELFDEPSFQEIGPQNFTGFNGLWNTCAFVRVSLLQKRGFSPEVFSAEDQEWTRWLLFSQSGLVARIAGGGMRYENPLQDRRMKRLREQVAVALYAKPEMLGMSYLARVFYRAVRPVSTFSERVANARLLRALVYCRLRKQPPPYLVK